MGEGRTNMWGEPNDGPVEVEGPCLSRMTNAALVGGAAGTFFGACQLAWYPDPISSGPRGRTVVTRTDLSAVGRGLLRPAVFMAAAGSAFATVECLAESFRNKKDSWNSVLGGMAAGVVMASTTKRFDIMTSTAIGVGLFMGMVDFAGPSFVVDPIKMHEKNHGVLPQTHVESQALKELKEKYPKFENL